MLVHVYLEKLGSDGAPTDKLVKITQEPIEACSLDSAFAAGFDTAEFEIDKLMAPLLTRAVLQRKADEWKPSPNTGGAGS